MNGLTFYTFLKWLHGVASARCLISAVLVRYQQAKQSTAVSVPEAKTHVWVEFSESMEGDFQPALEVQTSLTS